MCTLIKFDADQRSNLCVFVMTAGQVALVSVDQHRCISRGEYGIIEQMLIMGFGHLKAPTTLNRIQGPC